MLVSVIVPCRNERQYIEGFLESVLQQKVNGFELEVLVADGQSNDGTREVLERYAARYGFIKVIDNPAKIVSAGLNAALGIARGDIIVRMDVHTTYAEDYIDRCVETLLHTGADNVGGPWVAQGSDRVSRAIALAFDSPLASGGAKSHDPYFEGPVDSVYLGCWPRRTFERFGLFDEELVRNQDNEHNLRIWRLGGRVWQSPAIRSWYHPRRSLRALWRQYVQYGYWKMHVLRKHRVPASARHLVPGLFVGTLLFLTVLGAVSTVARVFLSTLLLVYASSITLGSVSICYSKRAWASAHLVPLVLLIMHFGYGYGFLVALGDLVLRGKRPRPAFTTLTR